MNGPDEFRPVERPSVSAIAAHTLKQKQVLQQATKPANYDAMVQQEEGITWYDT